MNIKKINFASSHNENHALKHKILVKNKNIFYEFNLKYTHSILNNM